MNKEEIDKWLYEKYGCSYKRLEELHDFYFEKYTDLKEEYKQLKEIEKEHQRINGELREELQKANDTLDTHNELINHLQKVIEEVRKKLKLERKISLSLNQAYTVSVIDSVLQILDKGADK